MTNNPKWRLNSGMELHIGIKTRHFKKHIKGRMPRMNKSVAEAEGQHEEYNDHCIPIQVYKQDQ